jgi:hypothetical protein
LVANGHWFTCAGLGSDILIHRQLHGVCAVADPFVRQAWQQRKAMQWPRA